MWITVEVNLPPNRWHSHCTKDAARLAAQWFGVDASDIRSHWDDYEDPVDLILEILVVEFYGSRSVYRVPGSGIPVCRGGC